MNYRLLFARIFFWMMVSSFFGMIILISIGVGLIGWNPFFYVFIFQLITGSIAIYLFNDYIRLLKKEGI